MSQSEGKEVISYEQALIDNAGYLPRGAIKILSNGRKPHVPLPVPEFETTNGQLNPYDSILKDRPKIDPGNLLADFKARTGFRERNGHIQIVKDVIGVIRKLANGEIETYEGKLKKEEEKGHTEAASYGEGNLGRNRFIEVATHWNFFAGSFGAVVGEKIKLAAELAGRKKQPLVGIFSSGGARQQENIPALLQMTRTVHSLEKFKQEAKRPFIAVLLHQVWGGLSASVIPRADVAVAVRGTNFGFTGPRVIESYTYEPVPEGAQSAEAGFRNRTIDMIIEDKEALIQWLERFLKMDANIEKSRGGKVRQSLLDLPPIKSPRRGRYPFDKKGFFTPVFDDQSDGYIDGEVRLEQRKDNKSLYDRYMITKSDPRRPDTEYILTNGFTDVVPLYSVEVENDVIHYPAIIAALAKLGEQPFLVIGNQPSYQRMSDGRIVKIPASPAPPDYLYVQRMLDLGERRGIPALFLTDTLGAKPTLDAEIDDQSRKISDTILKTNSYQPPTIAYVIGALGSGGGLATTPIADYLAMTENSWASVAEPNSATTILYNEANPSLDKLVMTMESMRITAKDQLELNLIDAVIPEPQGGSEEDPLKAVELIRNHTAKICYNLLGQLNRRRLSTRKHKINNAVGFTLKGMEQEEE
ncbi:hypothetical protein HYT18_02115 [Candidatus Microgenomates bacterium]|nr:hypothetical protein [Candidatus Microgenomates bacterium]